MIVISTRTLARVLLIVALIAAFVGLDMLRDAVHGPYRPAESVLYVRSGEVVRRLSLSYSGVVADLYWVRAVQHYGGTRLSRSATKRYDLLHPLLDLCTSLDPQFHIAYRFGAIFLAEPFPGGAGRPDQAIALLQKGFRANPTRWQYLQDIGFIHYWWLGDFAQAGRWFERAADVPQSPWWLRSLAAVTLAQGGDRRTSRTLWRSLRDTAEDDWIRGNAELRLQQLDAIDALETLAARVDAFQARVGRPPDSWGSLIGAGLLRRVPVDPAGIPFVLEPGAGAVTVDRSSPLFPLPVEPRSVPAVR